MEYAYLLSPVSELHRILAMLRQAVSLFCCMYFTDFSIS